MIEAPATPFVALPVVGEDGDLPPAAAGSAQAELIALIESLPDQPRLGELLVAVGAITPGQWRQSLRRQAESAAAGGDDHRFIRVQAQRLDRVVDLLGELVIAGAGAQMLAREARHIPLIEASTQIGRLLEEVRNGTLQMRMVPIDETFARLGRVVRDGGGELGKQVALQIEGGDTELDKSVLERIAEPLMHLVRHALDHGLERPEARVAAGKPAQGTLTLSACHEAGSVLIRIADDGAGLSVHGVGMDVVRTQLEALRGTVAIRSEEGEGSTIELRLPLSLAIFDGFLIGIGHSKFIAPLEAVVEVIESRHGDILADARGRTTVELRGSLLPVVDLRALYALEPSERSRVSVVVLQSGGHRYGIVVDTLHGQHQTVIKPLSRMFRRLRGVAGSTILGSGEVALICDVNALHQLAASSGPVRQAA